MPVVVLGVGVLVTAVSLFLLVRPGALAGLLDKVFGSHWLYGAALLRLLLGAALIASADTVAFPRAIELLGWLFVFGGLCLVVIPAPPLRKMAAWFAGLSAGPTRLWLCLALLFGLFLLYAAVA